MNTQNPTTNRRTAEQDRRRTDRPGGYVRRMIDAVTGADELTRVSRMDALEFALMLDHEERFELATGQSRR